MPRLSISKIENCILSHFAGHRVFTPPRSPRRIHADVQLKRNAIVQLVPLYELGPCSLLRCATSRVGARLNDKLEITIGDPKGFPFGGE